MTAMSRRSFALLAASAPALALAPRHAHAGDPLFGGAKPAVPPPFIVPSLRNPRFFQVPSAPGHYYARAPIGRFWGSCRWCSSSRA